MLSNLGSFKNAVSSRLLNKRYPMTVSHIITTRCNLRCNYCNMWKHTEAEMTKEQIFRMLDEFSLMGLRRYGITGGEPLLRDDIGEIVDYAKGKGCIVTLFSNGFLFKERSGQLDGLDVLLTSLDGPEAAHDSNRQKGSYAATMKAISLAREKNIAVWVGVTLTKNNLDYMDDLLKLSREMDFKVLVQPVYNYPGYSAPKEEVEVMSDFGDKYVRVVDDLIKKKRLGFPLIDSYTYLKHMRHPHDQKANSPCWASRTFCAVTPSGNVSPCFKIYSMAEWPNGVKLGFKKAFDSIPKNFGCTGCFSYATTESNLFYSLHPEVLYNTYRNMISPAKCNQKGI